ncbi:hypothetical protein D9619_008774 [Psilocybe cf. subviscida]|uniref:Reverse transcriptase domain-containing protein n=1 Tax=Psilocybe cf. subviscida TaxID=2480587 RepID=A0A8H5B9X7_9AGAR|nr:hypothetical protein D9619_008774 [Psilocybe cf. subviscida]
MSITLRTDIIEHRDIQVLDVSQGNNTITIINVYNDPRLKELKLPSGRPTLITGDFNLHHILWSTGPVGQDRITNEIVDWLSEKGYTLLNEKGVITHPARNRRERDSVIDLSFANPEAISQDTFKDWCVDPSLSHDSDHYAIRFTIDHGRHEIANPLGLKYSLKHVKANEWVEAFEKEVAKVEETLEKLTSPHIEKEDIDDGAHAITVAMQNATAQVGKERRPSPVAKPWWDEELSNTAKELANARMEEAQARRQGITNHRTIQRKIITLRNYFHRQCRKKKKSWAIQKLENANELEIWQFQNWSKGQRNYPSPPIQRGKGMDHAVLHTDKCEALRSELLQPPPQLPIEYHLDLETPVEHELQFEEITEEEVYEALHKNSTNTAPGYSQVTYKCIQWAWATGKGKRYIYLLMNKCLQVGYHPRSWRQAVAVALRKPNKPDYSNPRAYRLITLLECLGKVLERIVARRLTYLAGKYDLIPPGQFGGKSNSSTTDALLTFVNDIQSAWNHGYATTALTFDIKGYFDFVNHKRLLSELRRKKLPIQYIKWTASFLEEREAAVCLDGKVGEMKKVQNGIPQGSPVSPILAAFYTAELLELFHKQHNPQTQPHPELPTDTQLLMYVDDGNLYVSSPSLDTNITLLENAYEKVHEWLGKAGLSADPVKRELIHYCKPRSKAHTTAPSIQLCDDPEHQINPSSTVRWLGVHFDRQLRFEQHVKLMAARGENAVNGMTMLANTVKGLSQIHTRRLYLGAVVPKILYAAPVWWRNRKYQQQLLEKVQHRALRLICAAFKTTPIKALEIEASVPPIHLQIKLITRRLAIRFNKLPISNPIIQRLDEEWLLGQKHTSPPPLPPTKSTNSKRTQAQKQSTTLLDIVKYTNPKHERIDPFLHPPWRRLTSAFNGRLQIAPCESKKRSSEEKRRKADEHINHVNDLNKDASNLIVYTDSSLVNKNGFSRVGAAAVTYRKGRETRRITMGLGGRTEVYDGELAALTMGITVAVDESKKNPTIKHIHIFSDNVSALSAICDPKPTGGQLFKHTFHDKATTFLDSDDNHRLSISWCPSHSGVAGNERADELAKQATQLAWSSPISTSRTNALRRSTLATQKEWTREWKCSEKQSWFAIADRFQPSLKPTKRAKHLKNRREIFGRLVQARTGHAYTGEFRRRFFPGEPFRCPCDNQTIETREHIIISCPRYEEHRDVLRKVSPSIALSEIFGTQEGIEALAKFLEVSGAFTRNGKPRPSTVPPLQVAPLSPPDPMDIDDGNSTYLGPVPALPPPLDFG